ncbi:MAG: hypothetical protein ACI4RT_09615 [Candidatus Spyradenecus sp.]
MASGTTIAEMLADLAASKAAIVAALTAKGVTVPSGAKFEDLAALVAQVEGGSGGSGGDNVDAFITLLALDKYTATELVIPEGTTRLGSHTFFRDTIGQVSSVSLPSTLVSVGDYALCVDGTVCRALTVPSSVAEVGDTSFGYGASGMVITFEGKTMAQVRALNTASSTNNTNLLNLASGTILRCTDGDITI